jgi:hypothetical protein
LLDKKREDDTRRDPSKRWRERTRIIPLHQKDTEFHALPLDMPIDYYDPVFYNALQPRLRHRITNKQVALLPDVKCSFSHNADEKLSDEEFMLNYADSVLARYNLVDDGEFNDANDEDWIEDDAETPDDDEEWEDVEDMGNKRNTLVAHFSQL